MGKSLWPCFLAILLCGISNLSYAEMEITVYGGKSFRKGLCLEMDNTSSYGYGNMGHGNPYSYNQSGHCRSNYGGSYDNFGYQDPFGGGAMGPQNLGNKTPWIMGGDIIYRIPTVKGLGIGVRYQYMLSDENQNALVFNLNPKFNTHRIGVLLNYRHILTGRDHGPFFGAILSLDIFRHTTIKFEAGLSTPFLQGPQQVQQQSGVVFQMGDYSSNHSSPGAGFNIGAEFEASNWIGTGQAALEAGFKLASGLLIKVEAGYSLYTFSKLESSLYGGGYGADRFSLQGSESISVDIHSGDPYRSGPGPGYGTFLPNMKADLSGFYITLGIGFTTS